MSAQFDVLKQSFEGYVAHVQQVMDRHKSDVQAAVTKALAEHDTECTADLKTLQDEITAANDKLNAPAAPVFTPSGNG